jgi:oxygen-dependent protoporphyrinogen oxidase
MNVLVIGAGLSGLAAAWRLRQAGHRVALIEQKDQADGDAPFRSVETLHSSDGHVIGWMRELGLSESLLPLRPVQIAQVRHGKTAAIDPQHLLGISAIPGVRKLHAARLLRWSRLMARYLPLLDPAAPERAAALDYRSVSDFAGLYFGESVLQQWVAPEVEDFYSGRAAELSRVTALLLWRTRMTGRQEIAYSGLPRLGLAPLFRAANRAISTRHHGVALRLDGGGGQEGYEVTCAGSAVSDDVLHGDAVVVATSPGEAARLGASVLEPAERDFLTGARERPTLTLTVELDRAPSGIPERVRIPHGEGFAAQSIVFEPGSSGSRMAPGAGLATVRAREDFSRSAAQMSDDVAVKSLLADLKLLYPAFVGSVASAQLHRSEAGIPAFEVGAYRGLERFRRVQEDRRSLGRRLYFAGDYLISPSVEGRVVSGFRAAADLIADVSGANPGSRN